MEMPISVIKAVLSQEKSSRLNNSNFNHLPASKYDYLPL